MTKADELWEKYAVLMYPPKSEIPEYVISTANFHAALAEYGEAVRAEAVKVCVNRIDPHPDNALRNAIIYDCAAAIEKMKLP